jgi:hypothetical protein
MEPIVYVSATFTVNSLSNIQGTRALPKWSKGMNTFQYSFMGSAEKVSLD